MQDNGGGRCSATAGLLALMTTAVDGLVAKARTKLEQAVNEELTAKEVAEQRGALERVLAATQRHQEQNEGRAGVVGCI